MDLFKKMGKNWSKNTKSKALGDTGKKAGWTLLGGVLYTLIPTAIQGWGGFDLSGLKGIVTGAVGSSVVGMLADKKEITTGGLATAGVHLTYTYLNGTITDVFGSPIFGASTGAVTTTTDQGYAQPTSDSLPQGYAYNSMGEIVALNMPDDQTLVASQQPVSSYTESLNDLYTTSLNDYTESTHIDGMGSFMGKDLKSYGLNFI